MTQPSPQVVPLQTCGDVESVSTCDMQVKEEVEEVKQVKEFDEEVKDEGVDVSFHSERVGNGSQTDLLASQMHVLKQEQQRLKDLLRRLTCEQKQLQLNQGEETISSFERKLQEDGEMCEFYLGFPFQKVTFILNFLDVQNMTYLGTKKKRSVLLTETQEFIIFLLRIRGGLDPQDISFRFGLPSNLVSQTVDTWIQLVYCQFSCLRNSLFFSREKIKATLPKRFSKLSNVRVIVDCAELICERPSNYKVLLGCSPNGVFSYVSDLFEGSISDEDIFQKSGLIDLLEPGDLVLADGEFNINGIAAENRFKIDVPAFLKGRKLTPQEESETRKITQNRIFVEHDMVRRLAEFRVLNGVIPQNVCEVLSKIVFICVCLLNFNPPLLDE